MKTHKLKTISRIVNGLNRVIGGCTSATCPFHDDDCKGAGTAHLCTCRTEARELSNQLDKELKSVGI